MKQFQSNRTLTGALTGALLLVALLFGILSVQSARAADPVPQGIASYLGVNLLQYGNLTATTGISGVGILSPGFALADCYNNVSYGNFTVVTATTTIQSSEDGVNWVDTWSFVDVTPTTEISRVVLYGTYTRANLKSLSATSDPVTGTVQCKLTNQSR
jgi:hypothetical protein